MNPVFLTNELQRTLVSYLTTTFDVNRDGNEPELAAELQRSFNTPGALFNGPFLELTPPYEPGQRLDTLIAENVLSSAFLDLPCYQQDHLIPKHLPLYKHQEQAIRKLCHDQRNIVVSSGTGSGKTECFLVPILNDLVQDKTPGVRALLVYPMNALVNDQLDRLRKLLKGTDITFGRYTGETPQNEKEYREKYGELPDHNEIYHRDQIRKEQRVPQILITNYAMLEYLFLRPDDGSLFQSGVWKYAVLDEAHTYAGAQGIEVGFLLRRLKQRLRKKKGEMRCIATSATLTTKDADKAAEFARNLFGEEFTESDIIFGQEAQSFAPSDRGLKHVSAETYLDPSFDELIESVRQPQQDLDSIALWMNEIGLIDSEQLGLAGELQDPAQFLWHIMRDNYDLNELKRWMLRIKRPVSVQAAADKLFPQIESIVQRQNALYRVIELGAIARSFEDQPPLLPARYHVFARAPQGVWACLNPNCAGKVHNSPNWSRLFAGKRETCDICGSHVYPVTACRTCGQTYIRMEYDHDTQKLLAEADSSSDPEIRYLTWKPVEDNLALADETEDDDPTYESSKLSQKQVKVCLECQHDVGRVGCTCHEKGKFVDLHLVVEPDKPRGRTRKKLREKTRPVTYMGECCRCHDTALKNTEIVTDIGLGGSTPLSILTSDLYRRLPPSNKPELHEKPGNGRKLLTFYDSRQGAARFAAFLQDADIQTVYSHLIPQAIVKHNQQKSYMPDVQTLIEECTELGWEMRVFQNDMNVVIEEGIKRDAKMKPSSNDRERLKTRVATRLFAQITTQRNSRQSLEALGLVSIEYFEEDNLPDFASLGDKIGMGAAQTRTLVEYLLDQLRHAKAVTFPRGIDPRNELFGRNVSHPSIVRRDANNSQLSWQGKTERHRRRQLVRKMLHFTGQDDSDSNAQRVLSDLYDWLVDPENGLMDRSPARGYRLRHKRLFFKAYAATTTDSYSDTNTAWLECSRCLRLSSRGDSLPCPHHFCSGTLQSQTSRKDSFYFQRYAHPLVPMRVEEHTAQLDTEKGGDYQRQFKRGDINVLSCSTTFEMGIDLGDLQAVAMSNIPPTVANYKQRAGRAGRNASGTALILSWASDRPHDQTYFVEPEEIIAGDVRVPFIDMHNDLILRRHINAILLSLFLRHRFDAGHTDLRLVGNFFDEQKVEQPHFAVLGEWLDANRQSTITNLKRFTPLSRLSENAINNHIEHFRIDMTKLGNAHYQKVSGYYKQQILVAKRRALETDDPNIEEEAAETRRRLRRLLSRLQEREQLINWLSGQGILPSYSFPLHTVELRVEKDARLRLQRDLRVAIREYAPGQEVVADKRIWTSGGISIYGDTLEITEYRICSQCNHLQIAEAAGFEIAAACPVCKYRPKKNTVQKYIKPDGFWTNTKESGHPAGQYVHREHAQMKSALVPESTMVEERLSTVVTYSYSRRGQLLHVNEGAFGSGFKLCMQCGAHMKAKTPQSCNVCKMGRHEQLSLGVKQQTDTLHLRFDSTLHVNVPPYDERSFWLSLTEALLHGASRELQIERRDIGGVLHPIQGDGDSYRQTVVLYDNVPGGAGHVRAIHDALPKVVEQALRIVNCESCSAETSCSRCLRDYSNQWYWSELKRGKVATFLEAVHASLQENQNGWAQTPTLNKTLWLFEKITESQQQLSIAADSISLRKPTGKTRSWMDVIDNLLTRNVAVTMCLRQKPATDTSDIDSLLLIRQMQVLLGKGLKLYQIATMPECVVCIDPYDENSRAIQISNAQPFHLDANTGSGTYFETSILKENVIGAFGKMNAIAKQRLTSEDFELPPNIIVHDIPSDKRITEAELFGDLFEKPLIRLEIRDQYLYRRDVILKRVGAYLKLAEKSEHFATATIYTGIAGKDKLKDKASFAWEQKEAIAELQRMYPQVSFDFSNTDHDRSIIIHYKDDTKARIQIGIGLDFIRNDSARGRTSIIVERQYKA